MHRAVAVAALLFALATPVCAQRRVDLIIDAEGVRRTSGTTTVFTPFAIAYVPHFSTGGGAGFGVDWFLSDHTSVEAKVSGLYTRTSILMAGSDFVTIADLGRTQVYPITLLLKWHMLDHGSIRPYLGAGAGHVVLRNINNRTGSITGTRFHDPTGLVVDGGLEWRLSQRFSFVGDARYTPIETQASAQFLGPSPTKTVQIHVKPLVVGFGVAYHY